MKIAVWPDGEWCYPGEINEYMGWRGDDFEVVEVEFDDNEEPLLPARFAQFNWR